MTTTNRRMVLARRPVPAVAEDCFRLEESSIPEPGEGQFLVRVHWLSIDPAMRGWIADGPNYSPPVPLGEVMRSFTVGQVTASRHPDFPEGTWVSGRQGWQEWALSDGSDIDRIADPADGPLSYNLHLWGMTGLTAYLGLTMVGQPQAGETVAVSTAAGSVGSIVGQVARILGCRTVGFTGGPAKVAQCLEEFRYDAAIDYKASPDLAADLAAAAPDGIDVYYDNTGGPISDAVMERINVGARIVVVGTMAIPSSTPPPQGPRYNRAILVKRARMQGFLVLDHFHRLQEAVDQLGQWYREGRIHVREDVGDGLESAPRQLLRLLAGENEGKALVRLVS
ncbi:NADP-dependent oxidoreductase [Aquibaculum arenosum]|uniref:NADP-dependent oxidoreductase n=1 Tax=Aquibaculum arenosum TaxID=3032591 RepID=A0ABT5YNA5_9PROT|nr:NADP-dependent oxidoreductase [Fodinicurvata sp. CAU 1616]MDF2096220.1 NADP-dependent oxidoreductase [Fodinicurvata sp. CAU 1616]